MCYKTDTPVFFILKEIHIIKILENAEKHKNNYH